MAIVQVTPLSGDGHSHQFEPLGLSGPLPTERCRCSTTRYHVPDHQVTDVVELLTRALSVNRVEALVAWDRRR